MILVGHIDASGHGGSVLAVTCWPHPSAQQAPLMSHQTQPDPIFRSTVRAREPTMRILFFFLILLLLLLLVIIIIIFFFFALIIETIVVEILRKVRW